MKKLAEKYHAGQPRKGEGNIPYIVHPRAVAEMLITWGAAEDSAIVQMAWGHDLLEDTTVTKEEILAVSSLEVLRGIEQLSCPENMEKSQYLQNLANSGDMNILLVKIADRISNSKDFVTLKGKLHAYRYMHKADCLIPALKEMQDERMVQNALNAWKELEDFLRDDARHDAIRGCLLGGAVGDALGAPIEFDKIETIRMIHGPQGVTDYVEYSDGTGSITDDTQMTLFTAEGVLRAYCRNSAKGICDHIGVTQFAYKRWLVTQGFSPAAPEDFLDSGWLIKESQLFKRRAPGTTCIHGLLSGERRAQNDRKGCGTVMRVAPIGLFTDPDFAYEYGCDSSALTHGHPTGIIAGGAFAMLISFLMEGKTLELSLDLVERRLACEKDSEETLAAIRKARTAKDIAELGEGWIAEEALAVAIFCALRHSDDFKAGVLEAINITGDSDTTGSMTGNILGLLNGEKAIPENWRKNLREYAIVSQVADDLHQRYEYEDGDTRCPSRKWWAKYPGF